MIETRTGSLPLQADGLLTLSFTPIDDETTFGFIDLRVGGQTIGAQVQLSADALDPFISELSQMHRTQSGSATIRYRAEQARIVLEVGVPNSDDVVIRGHFVKDAYGANVTVDFEGLRTDQSALAAFIKGLSEPTASPMALTAAVHTLRAGGLVAFPTETVYGLGADATNAAAVRRIFEAKGRPSTNPLIVHAADVDIAKRYAAAWTDAAEALAAASWPGPLTLVVPKSPAIVDEATAGRETVGLRVPDHPVALELLRAFGGPVAAPSANRSNRISPTTAAHVRDELGDSVDMVLEGGPCRVGIESTVLDLTGDVPTILRPGGVSREQIERVVGPVRVFAGAVGHGVAAASPGQLPVHYAPWTPAFRFEATQRGLVEIGTDESPRGLVVLSPLHVFKKWGRIIAMPNDPADYAKHFYAVLREMDGMGLLSLAIEVPPDRPEWAAVRDRIVRATQPLPVR